MAACICVIGQTRGRATLPRGTIIVESVVTGRETINLTGKVTLLGLQCEKQSSEYAIDSIHRGQVLQPVAGASTRYYFVSREAQV